MSIFANVARWFLDPAHYQGSSGVPNRIFEHLLMSGAALLASAVVALPIAIVLGHYRKGGSVAINISNIGRAIPSFAILVLAVQVVGIGARPAFLALVALGIPPILTNTYIGLSEVNPELREAARGLGMTGFQLFWRVELPIAAPLIMAGIRTSAVQVVATATLAAQVAWGGLGRFIIDGFSQQDNVQIFAGAILVALVATVTERGLGIVQRVVTPAGLRAPKRGLGRQPTLASQTGVKAA